MSKKKKLQFFGEVDDLTNHLVDSGLQGEWIQNAGSRTFRAQTGEVINFYENGTLNAQGRNQDQTKELLAGFCESGTPFQPKTEIDVATQIFIVHGHDVASREQLELVLHKLGLKPFVQQNNAANSKTIIEALEKSIYEDSVCGIVLLTPDDMGHAIRDGSESSKPRARQNVILEMGMVMAALGREKMVILAKKGDLELPSDAAGIVRLEFEHRVQEQVPGLVQHLQNAGVNIDMNLIPDAAR